MGARPGKYKFGARAGKYKLGARAGEYKIGAMAGGQAKDRGPGNTNTRLGLINSYIHHLFQRQQFI